MIYFLLPKTHLMTFKKLQYIDIEEQPEPCISNSLSYYLCDIKEKINDYEKEWDIYKKYTNSYEYIHSMPPRKKSICKHKPLSRSYFKMIELMNTFKLTDFYYDIHTNACDKRYILKSKNTPLNSFHLAEGPGGFIEALCELRKNPKDVYVGMTIVDNTNDLNIPGWKKSARFLRDHKNVIIENGKDNTGNILNIDNFVYCVEKYKSSMDLITADGGFDFSMDFNSQENAISKLIFAQIAFAICMQKKNGSFILKIFDSFMLHTIDLLFFLSSFYEKVYITKPQTSRSANSEKYIVCKKFLFNSNVLFYNNIYNTFKLMLDKPNHSYRFLNISIPNYFLTKMEEYNSIFGQYQIENIYNTISLIESKQKTDKIELLIKNNIQKCLNWCIKFNVQFNTLHE
jgi:23S rRNA U2552 (ribose-2'-O)-methylase RlmE/FtsJ